jgi:hypothetical protein
MNINSSRSARGVDVKLQAAHPSNKRGSFDMRRRQFRDDSPLAQPLRCFVLLPLLVLAGCGSMAVDKAQYDRLRLGMTPIEVENILGKGKAVAADDVNRLVKETLGTVGGGDQPEGQIDYGEFRAVRWGSDKKNITVVYRHDRLFRAFQQGL